ncbi:MULTISPECIES: hypothetical protein [unclassified Microcoleus]|uniref:hypothetical protein n=1 Tax=unclassified Microcoleus TaxID=2642155 RepID=UPI002FD2DAED
MLETTQQSRSSAMHVAETECADFIRAAIASNDRQTALDIKNVLADVCPNGHADRTAIWAALTQTEQQQFKELLIPITDNFAKRIKQAIGWNSPGVALGIDCDLEDVIDRGEVVAADVVEAVGDRHFLEFQELVARCPKYFSELPAPSIEAATKKIS